MALDPEKTRRNAERLLRQGRVTAAIDEYKRLAAETPRDLPLLNLVGDLLVRAGRHAEAAEYFEKIATEFTRAGFFLKAIAILKKIERASPDKPEVLARIGDLYVKQKRPGEARPYLLQAADRYVKSRSLRAAREIYEKLAAAEPEDPLHRVRLAEVLAFEGNVEAAGQALLAVGASMMEKGRAADAEKVYRRAAELLPGNGAAFEGLGRCLAQQGRLDDAAVALERAVEGGGADRGPAARALLDMRLKAGLDDAALALVAGALSPLFASEAFVEVARRFVASGRESDFWGALDAGLAGRSDGIAPLLEKLAGVDPSGWVPALRRLADEIEPRGDAGASKRALELLLHACRAHGLTEEAESVAGRLHAVGGTGDAAEPAPPAPPPEEEEPAPAEKPEIPAEAPAVPLSPQDEEFVTGRLTQAEIFEKYDLHDQALDQVQEIVERYPGHVQAQRRLVEYLRPRGDRPRLRNALVGLALALRAAGERDAARAAVAEAGRTDTLPEKTRALLGRLSLLPAAAEGEQPRAEARVPEMEASAKVEAAVEAPPPRPQAPPAEPRGSAPEPEPVPAVADDLEIVLDLEVETGEAAPAIGAEAPPEVAGAAAPEPPADDVEEIVFYLEQGMVSDALGQIGRLRSRGFAGAGLDALEARARAVSAEPEQEAAREASEGASGGIVLDEEALSSIGEALSGAMGAGGAAPVPSGPKEFDEQSVEEVFAAFKQHVEEEIGGEDHRTHYDLGIAYKEMGLLDDAIGEFENALRAPEIHRDACTMIALCHREKGSVREAVEWYRRALELPGGDEEALRGLRYDLAEALLETGDRDAALILLREVERSDPGYRDVARRISDLEKGRSPLTSR